MFYFLNENTAVATVDKGNNSIKSMHTRWQSGNKSKRV